MQVPSARSRALSLSTAVFLPLLAAVVLWTLPGLAEPRHQPQQLPLTPLVIETADGRHHFEVMVAQSRRQRLKGLMYRRQMDGDHGMLFDYGRRPRQMAMWMKNTYLSLDMIFIRKDGTIANIAVSNRPHSLKPVPSDGSVAASLELMAGTTERLGIKAGDRVRHAILGNLETTP